MAYRGSSEPPSKKKTLRASEQERPDVQQDREVFQRHIEQVDPKRLVFFGEFGFNLNMTPRYARAPSGERAYGRVPCNRGAAFTLVMGIGLAGIVAPCAFKGAMNGHVFGLYMSEQVVPLLPPDAIVVVDNLGGTTRRTPPMRSRRAVSL